MIALYHYTCEHVAARLGATPALMPLRYHSPDAVRLLPRELRWMATLLWLTDLERPDRRALGLTSRSLPCDRTEVRYRAAAWTAGDARPWAEVRARYPAQDVAELEAAPGADPSRWWIARVPVPAILDRLL